MKTIRLVPALTIGFMMAAVTIVSAQVKIGSNPSTIDPNNNLEVESADPTKKVSINKTNGKITIADGSQGNGYVLTSDANGTATWQPLPTGVIVLGNLPTTHVTMSTTPNTWVYTGASITLPRGKWMLFVSGFMLNAGTVPANVVWQLSTSSTGVQTTGFTSMTNWDYPGFIKGQALLPNESDFNFATPQVIELTADTTLYVLATDGTATGSSQALTGLNRTGSAASGTACFYAQSVQ